MTIKQVLMQRDGLSEKDAEKQIEQASADLHDRIMNGEIPFDLCYDWFGLEPDYLDELI